MKSNLKLIVAFCCVMVAALFIGCSGQNDFKSNLAIDIERVWIGPEYWANPLQDWQLKNGRIECVVSGGDRNVFLLTHELVEGPGNLKMSVRIGRLNDSDPLDNGWIGFKVGVRGEFEDFRDNAVRGDGLPLGITTYGQLFIGKLDSTQEKVDIPTQDVRLELWAKPAGKKYKLSLAVIDASNRELSKIDQYEIDADWLASNNISWRHH